MCWRKEGESVLPQRYKLRSKDITYTLYKYSYSAIDILQEIQAYDPTYDYNKYVWLL